MSGRDEHAGHRPGWRGPALWHSLPFALYIAWLVIEDHWPEIGAVVPALAGIDVAWLYPLKAASVALALALLWRHYGELRVAPAAGPLLLGVALGVVVFVLWISLDASWMLLGDFDAGVGYNPRGDVALTAFRLAGAALVVPLMEELFWRAFLQRWLQDHAWLTLDPARVGFKALLITSALFAVEHTQWLAGLVAGLAYGWLYIRTRNLWVPVVSHAVTNGLLGAWVLSTGNWGYW